MSVLRPTERRLRNRERFTVPWAPSPSKRPVPGGRREADAPSVLIVEPDSAMAASLARACAEIGLRAQYCPGPALIADCPARQRERCAKSEGTAAVMVSIYDPWERLIAPTCGGDAPLLLCIDPGMSRARDELATRAAAILDKPYDPQEVAAVLKQLATTAVQEGDSR